MTTDEKQDFMDRAVIAIMGGYAADSTYQPRCIEDAAKSAWVWAEALWSEREHRSGHAE